MGFSPQDVFHEEKLSELVELGSFKGEYCLTAALVIARANAPIIVDDYLPKFDAAHVARIARQLIDRDVEAKLDKSRAPDSIGGL